MRQKSTQKLLRTSVFGMALLPAAILAQSSTGDELSDDIYLLSPFEVTTESNSGYTTTETLAGTRIKTDLKDLAQSISVINTQFLKDTGANSSEDLLVYTTNTEVGGVYGNYTGTGGSQTYNESGKLVNPSTNNRVRGLDAADNTRDYFLSEVPWDGYNVDRVEMQRGPNSILFGVGSPAGIINVTSKTAFFDDAREIEFRVDDQGSLRGVVDINQVILEDELAIRMIALDEHTVYQQKPAYEKDKRIFLSARYEPKIFKNGTTSIRVTYENGEIDANRPRSLPPIDRISPWFQTEDADGVEALNKRTINPIDTYDYYINNPKWQTEYNNTVYNWFAGGATIGSIGSPGNPAQYFDSTGNNPSIPTISRIGAVVKTNWGRNDQGQIDGSISGFDNFTRSGIAGYNAYATNTFAGGAYYSDYSLSDPTIFDFYNKLIDGDNKKEWQDWETVNASVSQTFLDNRIGFDLSTFYQAYEEGRMSALDGSNYAISVDLYKYQLDGSENPNVGRAFVGGSGSGGNYQNFIDRVSHRATAFADIRSTDFLEESWLTRVLGHHLLSLLVSEDTRKTDARNFKRWAYDSDFAKATGSELGLDSSIRNYDWISYIGGNMTDASITTPSGLNLSGVNGVINPGGYTTVRYFDSTWTGAATGPTSWADPYEYYRHDYKNIHEFPGDVTLSTSTQSENPDNYVGWTDQEFRVLSADDGDIDRLYSAITKKENTITSVGVTLQSYMLDDCLVATYGWRKDRVRTVEGTAPEDAFNVATTDYQLTKNTASAIHYADGISRTWGVVLHSPDFVNKHLPLDMKFSVFYGQGENFKADAPRGDVFGNQIDNPQGETKDYGFVISALDGRVSLKTTWYETEVKNATLPGTEGTGGLTYWIWAVPNWGTTYSLAALDGIADPQIRQGNWGWPWAAMVNYSSDDVDTSTGATIPYDHAREYIFSIVKDFFTNMPIDQHFADEYGMNINVDAMHAAGAAADYDNKSTWDALYAAMPLYGKNPDTGVYDTGPSGYGAQFLDPMGKTAYGSEGQLRSFSSGATATSDTISKGIEWELSARITDNWNVMLNVSKTEATINAVSPSITKAVNDMTAFLDTNAGNLCLWGSDNLATIWETNILRPYSTLMSKIGSSASEVSPWRANIITNYNFTEGFLKGVSVGMAYRWEDERVLGYQYNESTDALDITKPWYGPTEDHIDIWVGYGRAITDKIDWRIQLNVKNVGESDHLVPTYIQPDGTTGYSRIAYGTSFFVTNTFKF